MGLPSGSWRWANRPFGYTVGSTVTFSPDARSWATMASMSLTRKSIIQLCSFLPKYLVSFGNGAKAVGPASWVQGFWPYADGMRSIPSLSLYHWPSAAGSLARKKRPPIPVTRWVGVLAGPMEGSAKRFPVATSAAAMRTSNVGFLFMVRRRWVHVRVSTMRVARGIGQLAFRNTLEPP